MKRIEIQPMTTIEDAAIAVVTTANHTGEECRADFNGFDLVAHPLVTDEDDLIQAYYRHLAANEAGDGSRPGDELAADVILILTAILRDLLKQGYGRQQFAQTLQFARNAVTRGMAELPETGGIPISAARALFNYDQQFGNQMTHGQKAMLFIAAVELMQEQAAEDVSGK